MMRTLAIICLAGCSTTAEPPLPNARVRAYEEGLGAAGRVAVFQDARGRVKAVQVTDHLGIAAGVVDAGDMVTIANVGAPKLELTTYVDVRPGDEMAIGETELEGNEGAADAGALLVGVSALPAGMHAEVGVGRSMVPHGGGPLALHLSRTFFAKAAPTVQVLGIARDTAGVARAFAIAEAAGAGAVQLPAWRTDWDHVAFAISGLAPSSTIETRVSLVQGEGRFRLDPVTTAAHAFEIAVPRGLGNGLEYELVVRDDGCARSLAELGAFRHDVAVATSSLLSVIGSPRVTRSGDGRPIVSWTAAEGAVPDFVVVQLAWEDGAHRWTVVLPPGQAGSFRLPELPDSLAAWRPAGDLHVGIALVELSTIAGYHELMKRGVAGIAELAAAGSVRISRVGEIVLD